MVIKQPLFWRCRGIIDRDVNAVGAKGADAGFDELIDGEGPDQVAEEPPVLTYGMLEFELWFGRGRICSRDDGRFGRAGRKGRKGRGPSIFFGKRPGFGFERR